MMPRQFTAIPACTGPPNCCSASPATTGVSQSASNAPPAAPRITIACASSNSCLTIEPRPAPSAILTASSRRLSMARTSSRPARLVSATIIAIAAAPARRASIFGASPAMTLAIGVTTVRNGGTAIPLTPSSAALKSAAVAPCPSRASALTPYPVRTAVATVTGSGRQRSPLLSVKLNFSGRIPTIVCGRLPSTIWRPTAPGSPTSLFVQKA